MIHPPDVIQKYAPDAVLGPVVGGPAKPAAAKADAAVEAAPATGGGKVPSGLAALTLANMVEIICMKPWGYFK